MIHSAELISVGTELLLGEIVDTNSAWLAASLAAHGVDVYWSQRVGDNRQRIASAIEQALERSDLVVVGGGLGPTDDDLTREAIADVVGETPQVDRRLEQELRQRFASFSRAMPERNLKQAWLIPSAEPLANPLGTAPGWLVRLERGGRSRLIVALPGPPREMTRMWREEVLPRLELPEAHLYSRTFKTHGIGESALAEKLGELTTRANPSVATYARRDGVHVRLAAKADSAAAARALAAPVEAVLEELLEPYLWGRDDDELPELVLSELKRRGSSLAVVETSSGGRLCELLTAVSEAAAAFRGGMVAWSPQATATLVPTQPEAVSEPNDRNAQTLAVAVRSQFGAGVGVAVLGRLEPAGNEGGTPREALAGDEVDIVHLAVAADEQAHRLLRLPPLGTDWRRERTAFATLAFVLDVLRRQADEGATGPAQRTAPAGRKPPTNR